MNNCLRLHLSMSMTLSVNTCLKFEEDGTKYDHSTVFSPCKDLAELHLETPNEFYVLRH